MLLEWLPQSMSVCQISQYDDIDTDKPFTFLQRTDTERSLVCPTRHAPSDTSAREDGWRMMRVCGSMEFSMIGVIASLSNVLAKAHIPVFVISTFDTDYILVKDDLAKRAEQALREAGYQWRASAEICV